MQSYIFIFCLLAFSISWTCKFLISADEVGWIVLFIPKGLIILFSQFGPTIAGLIVIYIEKGKKGILTVIYSLSRFNTSLKWFLFALFFELVVFIVVVLFSDITDYVPVEFKSGLLLISFVNFIWNTFILTLLTGLGEEIGWRGFLLPKLQSLYPIIVVSIILTLINSLWHLKTDDLTQLLTGDWPGFLNNFIPDMGQRLLISAPVIFVIIYLFNKTKGNMLIMILFHGASNASYEWVKEMIGISDPAFILPGFIIALWVTSLFFIPAIIKQGRNKELITSIT